MTRIKTFKVLDFRRIFFKFSDQTEKTVDFTPFIKGDKLSSPLSDPAYFEKVELYENGRGIYWPNGYDFCPDYLLHHIPDIKQVDAEKNERDTI